MWTNLQNHDSVQILCRALISTLYLQSFEAAGGFRFAFFILCFSSLFAGTFFPHAAVSKQPVFRRLSLPLRRDNNFIKDFPQLADGLMVIPLPVEEQCRGVLSEPFPNLQLLTGIVPHSCWFSVSFYI